MLPKKLKISISEPSSLNNNPLFFYKILDIQQECKPIMASQALK